MFGIDSKAINEALDDFRVRLKSIEDNEKEILQRLRDLQALLRDLLALFAPIKK